MNLISRKTRELVSYFLFPFLEKKEDRQILARLDKLKNDYKQDLNWRKSRQRQQLANLVRQAKAEVPYYRELFSKQNIDPEKVVKDIRYFSEIPVLTKEIIREQGERMLSEKLSRKRLHSRRTNGSTGPSLMLYYSQSDLDWTAASNLFALEHTGKKRFHSEVHFSTLYENAKPSVKDQLREHGKCLAMNRFNIFTSSHSDDQLDLLFKKIRKISPYMIQGHPSTLFTLAQYLKKKNLSLKEKVKVFESTGESLNLNQVDLIEKQIGCKVYNRYGSAEFGVLAHSRDCWNELEVLDHMVYLENESEFGMEIIATGLVKHMMPLIRYRTGDMGEVRRDQNWRQTLVNLKGRVHESLQIHNESYPSHYFQDHLDKYIEVEDFQLVKFDENKYRLLLSGNINDERKNEVQRYMDSLFAGVFSVSVVSADEFVRLGWRNKFSYIVDQTSDKNHEASISP